MKLNISSTLALPLEAITQTFAILAKRGAGKSYTASVMAEEFVRANLPFVVLDPTGAWWGLRAGADGKSAGLQVVILGGLHGDVPLEPTAGKLVADLVVDQPGWYVLDMKLFRSKGEQDRFATEFAEHFYRRKMRHPDPVHMFVDEADSFAPQRPMRGQERMLGAFEDLVRRGRINGIGLTLITQRAAVLNKNVLSQTECLIALQTTSPHDRDAIKAWAEGHGTAEQIKTLMQSLSKLGQGEAWIWSPEWLCLFEKVQIRERRTFNSSATPKAGAKRIEPRALAAVDIDALRTMMAETIERVKADDPALLRKRIAELEKQVRVGVDSKQQIDAAREQGERHRALINHVLEQMNKLAVASHLLQQSAEPFDKACTIIQETRDLLDLPLATPLPTAPPVAMTAAKATARKQGTTAKQAFVSGVPITGPQQRILDAIAAFETIGISEPDQRAVAYQAGYRYGGGAFNNPRGSLNVAGLVEYRGDCIALTDAGRALANVPPSPLTSEALQSSVMARLKSGPERKILAALIDAYPDAVLDEDLAERTGYKPGGGAFNNPRGSLRTAGLITYPQPKHSRAADILFIGRG